MNRILALLLVLVAVLLSYKAGSAACDEGCKDAFCYKYLDNCYLWRTHKDSAQGNQVQNCQVPNATGPIREMYAPQLDAGTCQADNDPPTVWRFKSISCTGRCPGDPQPQEATACAPDPAVAGVEFTHYKCKTYTY
jgi:hypothetical protein